jgi:hypothetical protein
MNKIIARLSQSPKRLLLSASMLLCFLSFTLVPATAMASTPTCASTDVKCVIQFGDQQIAKRITALNKLSATITDKHNKQHIADDDADSLQTDVKTNIDGLNTLKTTLDAETDAKTARQDVEKIYTQFRIFAVVLPRDYRRLHLTIEVKIDNKLRALEASTRQLIDKAPANKKDQLNNLFNDYQAQLSDAESNIEMAQKTWPLLTPESYNTNRPTYATNLKNLTTYVKKAHQDLHKAAADLHKIKQLLKAS